jgi:hypothetical protein
METIEKIIDKFPNGKQRFNTDPIFNQVIMSLYHGADPLTIIDSLINSNNEITEAFRNYILKQ